MGGLCTCGLPMHRFVQRAGGRVLRPDLQVGHTPCARNFHRVPREPPGGAVVCGDVVEPPAAAPPSPPAAAAPAPASLPPALAWTTAVGVTVTSGVRREADGCGRLTHIFSIVDPNDPSTPVECHHGTEPQLMPRAPPRSRFLGSTDDDTLYRLAPSGATVRAPPLDAAVPVPELARPGVVNLVSSLLAAMTLLRWSLTPRLSSAPWRTAAP
eukprot:7391891-Prymnesium_polylepis.2